MEWLFFGELQGILKNLEIIQIPTSQVKTIESFNPCSYIDKELRDRFVSFWVLSFSWRVKFCRYWPWIFDYSLFTLQVIRPIMLYPVSQYWFMVVLYVKLFSYDMWWAFIPPFPVDTRRRFNVYKTSYRHWNNVVCLLGFSDHFANCVTHYSFNDTNSFILKYKYFLWFRISRNVRRKICKQNVPFDTDKIDFLRTFWKNKTTASLGL